MLPLSWHQLRRPTLTELGRKRGGAEKVDPPPPALCPDTLAMIPCHCPPPVLHLRVTEAQTARAPCSLGVGPASGPTLSTKGASQPDFLSPGS